MTQDATRPVQKRTNVRTTLQAARAAIHAVAPASRPLAARMAGELFLRPRRHQTPRWERELLARARSFRVPFGDAHLPAWEWGPAGAPPVLLVHGWEGRGSQLGAFVQPLLARGFRVVAFDGPGHGLAPSHRSSVVHLALGIERMAAVLGPLEGVVAHSVGGAATALALEVSRGTLALGRCVLVAPPVSPERFFGYFAGILALGPELRDAVARYIERSVAFPLRQVDVRSFSPHLRSPMLLVHDEGDREVPFEDGRAFAAAWPGSKLVVTSGLGHRGILKDPDVTAAAAAFIAGHDEVAEGLPLGSIDAELFDRPRRWARMANARS